MQFTKIPESEASTDQLAGSDQQIADVAEALEVTEPTPEQKLNELLGQLEISLILLSSAALQVASVVNTVSETRPLETLKLCGVEVPEEVKRIKVIAAGDVELENGKAATKQLVISGGKAPYTAELLEDPVTGLTVKQPVPFGPRVLIRTDGNTPAEKYNIYITDAAGHDKTIVLNVAKKKDRNGDGPVDPNSPIGGGDDPVDTGSSGIGADT